MWLEILTASYSVVCCVHEANKDWEKLQFNNERYALSTDKMLLKDVTTQLTASYPVVCGVHESTKTEKL